MGEFSNKIDSEVLVMVQNANPNGDPLNGNRPRETYDGYGEISDVCIKRKIRNRLQDMGENIFVQSEDRSLDECESLSDRAKSNEEMQKAQKDKDRDAYAKAACRTWIDVRSFGQVFAFKDGNVSVGVRGPVSVHSAFRVLAEKTGFSDEDAEKIKEALRTLFVNDSSSARPDGSMEVCRVYWWKHNCPMGQYSSAKVHRLVNVKPKAEDPKSFEDYEIIIDSLPDLELEEIEGI